MKQCPLCLGNGNLVTIDKGIRYYDYTLKCEKCNGEGIINNEGYSDIEQSGWF